MAITFITYKSRNAFPLQNCAINYIERGCKGNLFFWFYYASSCNVSVPLKFAFFKTNENNKVTIQFLLMNRATQESYLWEFSHPSWVALECRQGLSDGKFVTLNDLFIKIGWNWQRISQKFRFFSRKWRSRSAKKNKADDECVLYVFA